MIYPANFFGLTVYPGKAYTTVLEDDTHLTMAAITSELGKENGRTSVILTIDGNSFTLCSLTPGKMENQPLDIYLNQDDEVTFTVKGPCPIDLTGNAVAIITPEDGMLDDEDMLDEYSQVEEDEEIDSDEASSDEQEVDEDGLPIVYGESDEEEITEEYLAELKKKIASGEVSDDMDEDEEDFDDEDDSEDSDDEAEMEFDAALVSELNKRKMATMPIPRNDKKAKITEIVEVDEAPTPKEAAKVSSKKSDSKENAKPNESKKVLDSKKKDDAKKQQEVKKEADSKKQQDAKKELTDKDSENKKDTKAAPVKKTLPSGLIIEDSVVGTGPRAKSGHKVSVRYIGKLTNGKVFDSNTKGAPFSFKLGKGQVIKGWDMGVQGMNVGGTRKLTIPASLAYGSQGSPPLIEKNATLIFEVKLLSVK